MQTGLEYALFCTQPISKVCAEESPDELRSIELVESDFEDPKTAEDGKALGRELIWMAPSFVKMGDFYKVKMYFGNTTMKVTVEYTDSVTKKVEIRELLVEYEF